MNLQTANNSCVPKRMLIIVADLFAATGQPVKRIFTNPDATDHNLVIENPDVLTEGGMTVLR